jgi:hypothetical protein
MRGTYLFYLYADHIHCYISNMWTVLFSTLLTAGMRV